PAERAAAATAGRRNFLSFTESNRLRPSSALAVLEALAGARLTVLLALLLARVPRQEARALDGAALLGVERDERARDPVAHRFRLGALAAARAGRPDVELVGRLDELERLAQDHARGLALEVIVDREAVDDDRSGAGLEPDAGDGGLALAGGVRAGISCGHGALLAVGRGASRRSTRQRLRLLGGVRMVGGRVDLELRRHLAAEDALGEHALHGLLDGEDPVALEQVAVALG